MKHFKCIGSPITNKSKMKSPFGVQRKRCSEKFLKIYWKMPVPSLLFKKLHPLKVSDVQPEFSQKY